LRGCRKATVSRSAIDSGFERALSAEERRARDLALFNLAIDSKLRLDRETDDHRA
jgi:hypothetical protein